MTWTKLGDEWPDAARALSDAAYRTHVDGLCWSARRGLDLLIPRRDLRRFAETDDPDTAVKELVHDGWWEDRGDAWYVGLRFADWQLESTVVDRRRQQTTLRVRRHRMHQAGDHSLCLPERCNALRDALRDALPGTGRDGTGSLQDEVLEETSPSEAAAGRGGGAGEGGTVGQGRQSTGRRICRRHLLPLPCAGCAGDAKGVD